MKRTGQNLALAFGVILASAAAQAQVVTNRWGAPQPFVPLVQRPTGDSITVGQSFSRPSSTFTAPQSTFTQPTAAAPVWNSGLSVRPHFVPGTFQAPTNAVLTPAPVIEQVLVVHTPAQEIIVEPGIAEGTASQPEAPLATAAPAENGLGPISQPVVVDFPPGTRLRPAPAAPKAERVR